MQHRGKWTFPIGILLAVCCLTAAIFFFTGVGRSPDHWSPHYETDTWMHVFQHEHKVGYSHTRFQEQSDARLLSESLFLRMNAMGHARDVHMNTQGLLNPDASLRSLEFEISTDRPLFAVEGRVREQALALRVMSAGAESAMELPIAGPVYLPSAIPFAVTASAPETGAILHYAVFNPSEPTLENTEVRVLKPTDESGSPVKDARYRLRIETRGLIRDVWLDARGEILRETGSLGFRRERDTQYEARFGTRVQAGSDVSASASVAPDRPIESPETLSELTVRILGLADAETRLAGGRQSMRDGLLVIVREKMNDRAVPAGDHAPGDMNPFLTASPFIQSNDPRIRNLADEIVGSETDPAIKVRRIMEWIRSNVTPQPMLTVPDALGVLARMIGDCKDHAVLLAALARAVGVPAGIEAGLSYANGRFYYHAWNRVHVNGWITVDALAGQFPADVTHIRLVGGPDLRQAELIGIVGRLDIHVVEYR